MFQLSLRVRQTGRENVRTTVENYRTTASRGKKNTVWSEKLYTVARCCIEKSREKLHYSATAFKAKMAAAEAKQTLTYVECKM